MMHVMQAAMNEFKANRFRLLKYCLVVAVLCSGVSLLFQQLQLTLAPMLLTLIINVIFLFGLNSVCLKALKHETYQAADFLAMLRHPVYRIKVLQLFGIYAVILVGIFAVLYVTSSIPFMVLILPSLMAITVLCLNCINQLTMFMLYDGTYTSVVKCLKEASKMFVGSRKLILHMALKYILYILLGSFLVYAVNVFVYAQQINTMLYGAELIDMQGIETIFSTNISFMIQSVGIQLVVSYISIYTCFQYGTYYLQRNVDMSSTKKGKRTKGKRSACIAR